MNNPLIRRIAAWFSTRCPTCGASRIESLVYNTRNCPECNKHLTFGNIALKTFLIPMKISRSDLDTISSNAEAMASLQVFLRSISKQGHINGKFGIPIYTVFDIANTCNLHCIHCYSHERQKELTTTEVYKILDKLAAAGIGMIDFGGGEPLLRTDIYDILTYAKHLGFYTSLSTNGLLLDNTSVERLKALRVDHVCISLDGAKAETHDYIRQQKGTYERIIKGIRDCTNAGIKTQISTVVMNSNLNEVKDMHTLLESLHVNGWFIYDFVPAGRGKGIQQEVLNPQQRKSLIEYLQEIAPSSKIELKPYPYLITLNSTGGRDIYFYKKYGRLTEFFKGCLSGRWVCHISSNGDVHPCHLLPQHLGNLTQQTFDDIWFDKNNRVLKELRTRELLKGTCGKCHFRNVCGGCRAQAFWKNGDYLEQDSCWTET